MRVLNPKEGDQETETHKEDLPTAVLRRLRQAFYNHIQDPAREAAEDECRSAGKLEAEIEAAGKQAAENALAETLRDVSERIESGSQDKKKLLFLPTSSLLQILNADEEAPWADWSRGKTEGLSAEKLSKILHSYNVKSVRLKRGAPCGYTLESLLAVFERYLPDALNSEGS
jgi:hypothetical protein